GPLHAPLIVGENAVNVSQPPGMSSSTYFESLLKVQNLDAPSSISKEQAGARIKLLEEMDRDFLSQRLALPAHSHRLAYERAVKMMRSEASKAFNLGEETETLRDA